MAWASIKVINKGTIMLKVIVRVILSDPPCRDGNARFTAIPLKPLSDQ